MTAVETKIYSEKVIQSSKEKDLVEVNYIFNEQHSLNDICDLLYFISDHRYVYNQQVSEIMTQAQLMGADILEILNEFVKEAPEETPAVKIALEIMKQPIQKDELYTLKMYW